MNLLARIFGRRIESEDSGYRCVSYEWRGKLYVWTLGPR